MRKMKGNQEEKNEAISPREILKKLLESLGSEISSSAPNFVKPLNGKNKYGKDVYNPVDSFGLYIRGIGGRGKVSITIRPQDFIPLLCFMKHIFNSYFINDNLAWLEDIDNRQDLQSIGADPDRWTPTYLDLKMLKDFDLIPDKQYSALLKKKSHI